MNGERPAIVPYGDAALLVRYAEVIDPEVNDLVHALASMVRAARRGGVPWREPVPAYASLLVIYDPLAMDGLEAEARLRAMLDQPHEGLRQRQSRPTLEIPVHYGGEDGPDLPAVADRLELSPAQVVELHSTTVYRAYFLGFAPGFAYLGRLPERLQLPRRSTPRQRVPPGSVGIAGEQTAVYPLATPGGWHLLGRTDVPLWDAGRDPPALIAPRQAVRFMPVDG
jgi:inhibitor of KinA